jgi:hypothetical protein
MDIEKVNAVLTKAIVEFQDAEIDSIIEAMAGGYAVPSPATIGKKRAGSYVVPSPASLGIKKKRKRKANPKKWTKGFLDKAQKGLRGGGQSLEPVKAYLKGTWAVHSMGGEWAISHAPTGMSAFSGFRTAKDAKAAVDEWIETIPALLMIGKDAEPGDVSSFSGKLRPHISTLRQIANAIRGR